MRTTAPELECDFFQACLLLELPGEGAFPLCASGLAAWENAHAVKYQYYTVLQPPAQSREQTSA